MTGHRSASTQPSEAVQNLTAQLREMNVHLEGLEKERDFYFAKVSITRNHPETLAGYLGGEGRVTDVGLQLRDIEILVQQQLEVLQAEDKDDVTLRDIQKILYSTEVRDCDRYVLSRADICSCLSRRSAVPSSGIQQWPLALHFSNELLLTIRRVDVKLERQAMRSSKACFVPPLCGSLCSEGT